MPIRICSCLHHTDPHNAMFALHMCSNNINTETHVCRVRPNITVCVHISIGSQNRTNHNACHISLHVSSSTKPTHQSLRIDHIYTLDFMHIANHSTIIQAAQVSDGQILKRMQRFSYVTIRHVPLYAFIRTRIMMHKLNSRSNYCYEIVWNIHVFICL